MTKRCDYKSAALIRKCHLETTVSSLWGTYPEGMIEDVHVYRDVPHGMATNNEEKKTR